jgi:hypothetical protein
MRTSLRFAACAVAAAAVGLALPGTAHAAGPDLVANGGFEAPALANPDWGVFGAIDGWTDTSGCGIEVQNHVAGTPYAGDQFVELDSYCPAAITQTLSTVPGRWYTVTYAFSARPGVADNALGVGWDGAQVASRSADGSALEDTDWHVFSESVRATGTSAELTFTDLGESDSVGTYVDAVSVTARAAATKDECKSDGWRDLVDAAGNAFQNQGDCVSFVATDGRNVAAG